MQLTKQEIEVIKILPDKWFIPEDLPYKFKCRKAICNRLEKKGVLIAKLSKETMDQIKKGEHPIFVTLYKRNT